MIVFFCYLGAGIEDPGIRSQIFLPMKKNEKGLMEVDGSFITVNEMIKCDTSWVEEIHRNYDTYIRYRISSNRGRPLLKTAL